MNEVLDNKELIVLNNLIDLDNKVMSSNIIIDDVLKKVEFLDLSIKNALIIYNGDIDITKKIVNSNITNSLLYPNSCYLAINKYLVSKREDLTLSTSKNEYEFINHQDEFDEIVFLNDKELYLNIKDNYKNCKFIEI